MSVVSDIRWGAEGRGRETLSLSHTGAGRGAGGRGPGGGVRVGSLALSHVGGGRNVGWKEAGRIYEHETQRADGATVYTGIRLLYETYS